LADAHAGRALPHVLRNLITSMGCKLLSSIIVPQYLHGDWLGRESSKWPVFSQAGCKTF